MNTLLTTIYDTFFSKITDDMYMELSEDDTKKMVVDLFENSLHWFEFPRVNIYDYNLEFEEYNIELTKEEINIIATYMIVEWIGQ